MAITRIESDKVSINKPSEKIFDYLSDFQNFEKLMPEQVTEWEATADECSFNISGMATIGMKIVEKTPSSKILISSNGKVPFDFTLLIDIDGKESTTTIGQIVFESELNPMMKMMVAKPLGNFFNMLAKKMADIE